MTNLRRAMPKLPALTSTKPAATPARPAIRPAAPLIGRVDQTESSMMRSRRLYDECEKLVVIDKHQLDEEWVHHSELVKRVGDEHILAQSYRDEAKTKSERVYAEIELATRRASENKDAKESHIKALVATDSRVINAENDYAEWKTITARWGVLVGSFDSRQKALENLGKLWLGAYWGATAGKGTRHDLGER